MSHKLWFCLFLFCRWLLGTFTKKGDAVLDCFAGTGNFARACKTLHRHCVSVEMDEDCFDTCIRPIIHCPQDTGNHKYQGAVSEYIKKQREDLDREMLPQQRQYQVPLQVPLSPTRSTASSWPPGLSHDTGYRGPMHSYPLPSWQPPSDLGRPMYPPLYPPHRPMYPTPRPMYDISHTLPPHIQPQQPLPSQPPSSHIPPHNIWRPM